LTPDFENWILVTGIVLGILSKSLELLEGRVVDIMSSLFLIFTSVGFYNNILTIAKRLETKPQKEWNIDVTSLCLQYKIKYPGSLSFLTSIVTLNNIIILSNISNRIYRLYSKYFTHNI
jgi:hypothetical protein